MILYKSSELKVFLAEMMELHKTIEYLLLLRVKLKIIPELVVPAFGKSFRALNLRNTIALVCSLSF